MLEQIEQLRTQQIDQLLAMFDKEWWTQNRTRSQVETLLATVEVVVPFWDRETDQLAAFACAMSDGVFRATIMDVIVHDDYRGQGLGVRLVESLINHPKIELLLRVNLHCRDDLIPFYEQFGFEKLLDINVMKLKRA